MSRLTQGQKMPDFVYNTPFSQGLRLSDTVKEVSGRTALVFLRYYGCTLCQYDIHLFAENYERIRRENAQILVVLQSDPEKLAAQLKESDLPFAIVCDPEQSLYKMLDIRPAANKDELFDEHTMDKINLARVNFSHGSYEGNEMQLPAVFILDSSLTLTQVRYGRSVSDVPTPDELVDMLK